jgi:PHP family Zn ribbon phosphoesterase
MTLDEILALPNGATFRNADLHVHSFGASADVTDTTMTVEAIIEAAICHDISILAITDHNTDGNVANALSYAKKYAEQLLVLPGVEISTANGHVLVYFAPEQADAVRDLLARVEIEGARGGRQSHTRKSMADVIIEAGRLNGICVAAHIDRQKTGFEVIVSGYPNWKKDIICSEDLYGLECDDPDHLRWFTIEDDLTPEGSERKKLIAASL